LLDQFFRMIGYGLCHQLPERSFFGGGFQLPVCARDTGIYIGFALGLLMLRLLSARTRPSELPRWPVLLLIGLFVGAMGFDGVTSYAGLRETTNDIRLLTGLMTGWGLSALTFPMVNAQVWAVPGDQRVPDGWPRTAMWIAGLAATFVLTRWILPLTGALYPVALVVAIFVTFGAVNLVFVGLVPVFERRARRLRDLLPLMAWASVLTLVELGGAAWLRVTAERLLS